MGFTFVQLLIIAGVVALVVIIFGAAWRHLKRFVLVWAVIFLILAALKYAYDAGWIRW